ncbi:MAG: pilin [Candidatus Moraniibacteriota bacterium]
MQKIFIKKSALSVSFFLVFLVIFGFFRFASAASGLVPCGTGATDPCTLCHLIVGFKGLLDWGMTILVVAAITAVTISGVMYIISSGNPGLITSAKGLLTNSLIGFAIMLGAWLIINTTLTLLSVKTDLGIQKDGWYKFSCSVESATVTATSGSGIPVVSTVTDANSLKFQTDNIKAQYTNGDASSDLQLLLNCLAEKLGGAGNFTINSISDNNGGGANCYGNNPSWIQCTEDSQQNCCHHAKTSCHYGGTNASCAGKSYAIDVSEVNSTIDAAADKCNAKHKAEGTHTHISVPGGCGCDAGL